MYCLNTRQVIWGNDPYTVTPLKCMSWRLCSSWLIFQCSNDRFDCIKLKPCLVSVTDWGCWPCSELSCAPCVKPNSLICPVQLPPTKLLGHSPGADHLLWAPLSFTAASWQEIPTSPICSCRLLEAAPFQEMVINWFLYWGQQSVFQD